MKIEKGVCTDVIIRALRSAFKIDLQKLVHQDIKSNWSCYPKLWNLTKPDHNIDHRRVPNLMCFFKRHSLKISDTTYLPGDIIVWDLVDGILHIGILSDKNSEDGLHPVVIHNIAQGVKEEDILQDYKIVAHFRLSAKVASSLSN